MNMEIEPKAPEDYVEEEPDSEPERERDAEEVEEIFIKEKPVRKKRELTDAQREGLRKGREKMKARRLAKMKEEITESLKYKVLESMTSVKEFDNLSNLLEEITEDDIYDDEILRTKINDLFTRVNGKGLR